MTDTDAPRKRRGRPAAPEGKRRRNNLTFRIRDDLRKEIEERASASGRSISEEMENMIERSISIDIDLTLKNAELAAKEIYISETRHLYNIILGMGSEAAVSVSRAINKVSEQLVDIRGTEKARETLLEVIGPLKVLVLSNAQAHSITLDMNLEGFEKTQAEIQNEEFYNEKKEILNELVSEVIKRKSKLPGKSGQ